MLDWQGKVTKLNKDSKVTLTSTPIFLIEGGGIKKTSGFVVFLEVVGIILLIAVIAIGGLYCYKRFYKKTPVPLDKGFFKSLLN